MGACMASRSSASAVPPVRPGAQDTPRAAGGVSEGRVSCERSMPSGRKAVLLAAVVAAVLVCTAAAGFLVGSSSVSAADLFAWATGAPVSDAAKSILVNVRLPRVLAALAAGAALACAGAIIQAVLDNPLASPNVIGVNAGAGLAVLIAASLFPTLAWLPPLAAFAGALITAFAVFGISCGTNTSRLAVVLAGIALTSVFSAGMNVILIVNPDAYVGSSTFLVGGLAGVLTGDLLWPGAYIVFGLIAAFVCSGKLNILALGDESAHGLGMNVGRTRLALLALAAVLAGAAVSFAGLLGFAGLIVPHLVRFFVGHDNRVVLPLSAAAGAAFVAACDLAARVLFAPYEVPVGILMAFLGGPFFIYLILRNRKEGVDGRA